jgi:DNA polymerase III subunit beta
MLDGYTGEVAVQFDQGQIVFEWASTQLTSRLLEGQFPPITRLVPASFAVQSCVDRKMLLESISRVSPFSDDSLASRVILKLDSEAQSLTLTTSTKGKGQGEETIPAQITGDGMNVAFKVKYLSEGLKNIEAAEVQLNFNTATSPSVLLPIGSNIKHTQVIMPIQIHD